MADSPLRSYIPTSAMLNWDYGGDMKVQERGRTHLAARVSGNQLKLIATNLHNQLKVSASL